MFANYETIETKLCWSPKHERKAIFSKFLFRFLQMRMQFLSPLPVLPRQTCRQVLTSRQRAAGGGGASPPQTVLHVPFRLSGVTKIVCRRHTKTAWCAKLTTRRNQAVQVR